MMIRLRPLAGCPPVLLAFPILLFTGLLTAAAGPSGTSVALPPPIEFCADEFEVWTTQVSPAGVHFGIDYEFDQVGYRAQWRKGTTLRILDMDPHTGFPVGAPVIVDTGIASTWPAAGDFLFGGNGAEWAYSIRGSELFYMRPHGASGNNRQLMKAYEASPGVWVKEPLPEGVTRGFPIGSKDPEDVAPRIFFLKEALEQTVFDYDGAFREVPEDPDTERAIPVPITIGERGPSWIPGRPQIVMSLLDETGTEQVAVYDLDTGEFDMVTEYTAADAVDVDETWASVVASSVPDEIVIWFLVNNTELHFYLKDVTDRWVLVNTVNPSELLGNSRMPYVLSPEPCTFQGEPYIVFQSSVTRDRQQRPGNIYLMTPGSSTSCHFRLLSPEDGAVRKAPECLELQNRMAVYFVEWDESGVSTLYLAETGLP